MDDKQVCILSITISSLLIITIIINIAIIRYKVRRKKYENTIGRYTPPRGRYTPPAEEKGLPLTDEDKKVIRELRQFYGNN